MTSSSGTMRLARDERADLADFLATLTPEQWDAPTLCTLWRVRDVVAHIFSYEDLGLLALVRRFAAARFNADRVNAIGVAVYAEYGPDDLLTRAREHLQPSGLTAPFGGQIALTDGLIHHQASAAHSPCPATSHSTACRRRCGSHPEHHPSAPPNASADYDSPRPTWTGPPVTAPSLKVRAKHY